MKMAIKIINFISLLVICDLCIVIIKSAENEENRNYSRTPRPNKESMKSLLELRKHDHTRIDSDEEIRKKSRTDEGSSQARERLNGSTRVEFEPQPETGNKSKRKITQWTNEQYKALLRLVYTNNVWKGPWAKNIIDWKAIFNLWNADEEHKNLNLLKSQAGTLHILMRRAAANFDALHSEGIQWSDELGGQLLKTYFTTEDGDESKHGERILAEWRKKKYPGYERLSASYLFNRAETMLQSVMKFDISNPRGRNKSLRAREPVSWRPEHDEYFQYLWEKHPRNEVDRVKKIFNDAVSKFPGAIWLGQERVYERAKRLSKQSKKPIDVHETSGEDSQLNYLQPIDTPLVSDERLVLNVTDRKYCSFLDIIDQPSTDQRPSHNDEWIASTSSHPKPSHDQLDLELRLNTFNPGNQSPDTNLRL